MRTLTIVLVLTFLLSACESTVRTRYARATEVRGYDFTKYTEQGFLFTPEDYDGEYQSVGSLQVIVWPEVTREPIEYGSPNSFSDWKGEQLNPQVAVDSLYEQAQEMGADAIIRFNAQRVTEDIQGGVRVGYQASGFAIDREQ